MKLNRQIETLLRRAEVLVREQERAAQGGVLALPHAEFAQARKTLPMAEPNDIGVLLVPAPLSTDAWIDEWSPGPPVQHDEREVSE